MRRRNDASKRLTFFDSGEEDLKLCGVAFWDMHIVLQQLGQDGTEQLLVAWPKAATILQEKVEVKRYIVDRDQLLRLINNRVEKVTLLMLSEDIDEMCSILGSYKRAFAKINTTRFPQQTAGCGMIFLCLELGRKKV